MVSEDATIRIMWESKGRDRSRWFDGIDIDAIREFYRELREGLNE